MRGPWANGLLAQAMARPLDRELFTGTPLQEGEVVGYHGDSPTTQEDTTMSIQIKTTEGILTLSNATDVRGTAVLCVRGHKGVTLGFMGPHAAGGWLTSETLDDLVAYLQRATDRVPSPVTLEEAAIHLAEQSHG